MQRLLVGWVSDALGWLFKVLVGLGMLTILVVGGWLVYQRHSIQIPPLDLDSLDDFAQSSIITDREGVELFRFFEEDRLYVSFGAISPHLVNAIVATEDASFWTNPGIDRKGIIRAAWYNLGQRWSGDGGLQGASTITQQLIKNLLLTPERSINRKISEIKLSLSLNDELEHRLAIQSPAHSIVERQRLSKEYIMELYLNYIFWGNHAYGIQAAAQRYFGVDASELDILQSAILASMPKAPSRYDPYRQRDKLLGYRVWSRDGSVTPVHATDGEKATIQTLIQQRLAFWEQQDMERLIRQEGLLEFLHQLASVSVVRDGIQHDVYYVPGRKDYVLERLYEMGNINLMQLIEHFLAGVGFAFEPVRFPIKAPHFVYYVRDLVLHDSRFAHLGLTPAVLAKGGLELRTSLDWETQQLLEEAVNQHSFGMLFHGANNRAALYTDSTNGDILGYVGSANFWDEGIEGQNDMIQAARSVGSTIKPLIYSYLMKQYPVGPRTYVMDNHITVEGVTPQNADGLYGGLMTIKKALASSRNIPAIKTYFAVGGESELKPWLQDLGMERLRDDWRYGYSLSLGGGEASMLALNQAYIQLSTEAGIPSINPLLEIRANKGTSLYRKTVDYRTRLIPSGVAWLIWSILSERVSVPSGWLSLLTMPVIEHYGIKTGTSSVRRGEDRLARDGWIVWYNGVRVITIWVGNTNGDPMGEKAYGGTLNAPLLSSMIEKLAAKDLLPDIGKERPDEDLAIDDGMWFYKYRAHRFAPQWLLDILQR